MDITVRRALIAAQGFDGRVSRRFIWLDRRAGRDLSIYRSGNGAAHPDVLRYLKYGGAYHLQDFVGEILFSNTGALWVRRLMKKTETYLLAHPEAESMDSKEIAAQIFQDESLLRRHWFIRTYLPALMNGDHSRAVIAAAVSKLENVFLSIAAFAIEPVHYVHHLVYRMEMSGPGWQG